jgi:class 3 adenylate cyclase
VFGGVTVADSEETEIMHRGPGGAVYDAAVRRIPTRELRLPARLQTSRNQPKPSSVAKILATLTGDPRLSLEERLFSMISLVNGCVSVLGAPAMIGMPGGYWLAKLQLVAGVLMLLCYVLNRRFRMYRRLVWPLIAIVCGFLFLNVLGNADTMGGAHYYFSTAVVIGLALSTSKWQSALVVLVTLGTVGGLVALEYARPGWFIPHPDAIARWMDVAPNLLFSLALVGVFVLLLNGSLKMERQRSDKLLAAMLPTQVIEELRHEGRAKPRLVEQGTVLFADITNFTSSTAELSPRRVLAALDEIFTAIDGIIAANQLEKIKTIGDAYMAVGGVTCEKPGHTARSLVAALQIQAWMDAWHQKQSNPHLASWRLRVGIHCGPLVAGVIGESRPAFDVWGDTVNVASRHESASEPGRINISAEVAEVIDGLFEIEYRGQIPIKDKPDAELYFVTKLHERFADPDDPTLPGPGFDLRQRIAAS